MLGIKKLIYYCIYLSLQLHSHKMTAYIDIENLHLIKQNQDINKIQITVTFDYGACKERCLFLIGNTEQRYNSTIVKSFNCLKDLLDVFIYTIILMNPKSLVYGKYCRNILEKEINNAELQEQFQYMESNRNVSE